MKYPSLTIGDFTFHWGSRTYIMGILNITPDSFSGDGLMASWQPETARGPLDETLIANAVQLARSFASAGADILDVGGESTRPGAQPISVEEEINRVVPIIHALSKEVDALISIDTYKAEVAQAALEAGAHMVNDVWGFHADPQLASVVARHGVPVVLMHNRSSWAHAEIKERLGGRYIGVPYENLIEDIRRELMESVNLARAAGIPDEHIILDPGIGFGKTVEQNLELIDRLGEIKALGFPLLVGPSRKSFIGYTLDLPPTQRLEGTAAAVAVAIARGADIVRVHDVEFMVRVARLTDAIVRRPRPD
jgi:dihydropteroate synthase